MRSPVSRIAAAAVFVLAILGVAMLFQGGGGAAFAFDDFAASILEAKTVKCKMIVEERGPPAQTITSEVMVLDGARMRQVIDLPDNSKAVMITDLNQGKRLTLMPASKTATVFTSTSNRKDKTPEDLALFPWFRLFRRLAEEKPGIEHKSLGEKEIDGRKVVGFLVSSRGGDLSLWGDPATGLPVRVEMTMGIEGTSKMTLSDLVFNVDMDESLFSVEPPAGYTVQSQKPESSPLEEKDLIEMLREYSNLFDGAFPDSLDQQTTKTMVYKKANAQMQIQDLWESARLKGQPSEEQRRNLEKLLFKMYEVYSDEDQVKKLGEQLGEQLQELIRTQGLKTADVGNAEAQDSRESRRARFNELQRRVDRGLQFANRLSPNADAHYVGKGVSFGAADTPILWYRQEDSKNYRVIYADLSVRDSDTPPNEPAAQQTSASSSSTE